MSTSAPDDERRAWTRAAKALCLGGVCACVDLGTSPSRVPVEPASDAGSVSDAGPPADAGLPIDAGAPPAMGTDGGDLLAEGDTIFHGDAGGVTGGCASCHGSEGRGDVGLGPNIRGRTRRDIVWALANVDLMQSIHLSPHQIDAVAAYVGSLAP